MGAESLFHDDAPLRVCIVRSDVPVEPLGYVLDEDLIVGFHSLEYNFASLQRVVQSSVRYAIFSGSYRLSTVRIDGFIKLGNAI